MRRFWLIGLLMPVLSLAQEPLSVDDAVAIGLRNSNAVKIAESQSEQARQARRQALGLLGPRVDAQLSHQRLTEATSFGQGVSGNKENTAGNLVITYPVDLLGVSRKAADAARLNELAAEANVEAVRTRVKGQIRAAYFNAVRAQEALSVQQGLFRVTEERLRNARIRFEVGDIPRFDVLRFETQLTQADAEVLNATNQVRLSFQSLNRALSRPAETEIVLAPPAPVEDFALADAELIALALTERSEIRQLNYLRKARAFVTYTQRSGLTPSLTLRSTFSHNFKPSPFQLRNQGIFEAVVSVPIWDSGITRARIASAREDERQVELNLEDRKLDITLEVQSALVQWRNALQLLRVTQKSVELQTEAVRIAQLRYQEGESILLELTQAQTDLTNAQSAEVSARYQARIAAAALRQAVGRDDLTNSVPTPEVQN